MERRWLYSSEPIESACPMAITTSRLMPRTLVARSSSFDLPSGLITDLSKSNSTSAAKVTFSATGLGFASGLGAGAGGGGGGAGLGSGAGAGFGAGTGSGCGAGLGSSGVAHAAANAPATSSENKFLIIRSPLLSLLWISFANQE